jgi:hypothetical protein
VWRADVSRDDPRAAEEARQEVNTAQRGGAVRALLVDAIDYAGLFPPAQLDMGGAVAEYASYLASDDAWALGWFVVPAGRLEELGLAASALYGACSPSLGGDRFWPLSVVFGADAAADMARVSAFHSAQGTDDGGWWSRVDGVAARASTPAGIAEIARVVPEDVDRFIEIPVGGDVDALVRAIADARAFAKIRTGGTTADAFPASGDVVRFLRACTTMQVPFKATAGLHHPLRGDYPLTYAPDSASGTMYGFLNVMLAAALLRSGASDDAARAALEERQPNALRLDDSGVHWRDHHLAVDDLLQSRERAIRSFGSCSFREPIDDLTSLGVL